MIHSALINIFLLPLPAFSEHGIPKHLLGWIDPSLICSSFGDGRFLPINEEFYRSGAF
jgi:hypothetical protein